MRVNSISVLKKTLRKKKKMLLYKLLVVFLVSFLLVNSIVAENPYRFYEWNVTYGTISPLGVPQQVCLFNFFVFLNECDIDSLLYDFVDSIFCSNVFCFCLCIGNFDQWAISWT